MKLDTFARTMTAIFQVELPALPVKVFMEGSVIVFDLQRRPASFEETLYCYRDIQRVLEAKESQTLIQPALQQMSSLGWQFRVFGESPFNQ